MLYRKVDAAQSNHYVPKVTPSPLFQDKDDANSDLVLKVICVDEDKNSDLFQCQVSAECFSCCGGRRL
jgi:hypothetical protein